MIVEFSSTSIVAVLLSISLFAGLVITLILGICPNGNKKSGEAVPNQILSPGPGAPPFPGSGVSSVIPPAGAGGFDSPPPLNNFTTKDGIVNNMEAPETLRNTNNFDLSSVNFPNFNDFRGDGIKDSTRVQDLRAKSRGVSLNAGKGVEVSTDDESDSEYDSEYDSSSAEEDDQPPYPPSQNLVPNLNAGPPVPPERVTIQGRPTVPSLNKAADGLASMNGPPPGLTVADDNDRGSYKSNLQADIETGIQRNPSSPRPNYDTLTNDKMSRLLAPTDNANPSLKMESLVFNRTSVDGYGGNTVTREGKSVVSDISGVTGINGVGENVRKKVKRRKKRRRKKVDANGQSVRIRASKTGLDPQGKEVTRSKKKRKKRKSRNASQQPSEI